MVSRIEVIPSEVRGYGNILIPKILSDFTTHNSDLSETDNIYTMVLDNTPLVVSVVRLALNNGTDTLLVNEILSLTVTLFTENNKRIPNANADIYMDGNLLVSKTTNAYGVIDFEYEFTTVGTYEFQAISGNIESETITITVDRQNSNISVDD